MADVRLDDLTFFDEQIDATLVKWREAIEQANRWYVGGACEFDDGGFGFILHVHGSGAGARHAVVLTGGIAPAPDADTLGSGPIMLRKRVGNALTDDVEAVCRINFTTGIAAGTRITVVPDGADWTIPGANCPPPAP